MSADLKQDFQVIETAGLMSPAWFAVQTRPRYEKKVGVRLRERYVETFVPLLNVSRRWSDRHRLVEEPLFPGYLFVRITPFQTARVNVLQTIGVKGFVGGRGIGAPVPDAEIQSIMRVLAHSTAIQIHPYVVVGQRVRIRGGYLDGVEGILAAINGGKGLIVSVQLIQRSVSLRLEGFQVEPVWSGRPASTSKTYSQAPRAITGDVPEGSPAV